MNCIPYLWMAAACCICLPGFFDPVRAQDLEMDWFTAAPFPDPIAPACFGLITAPCEFAIDGERSNNTGNAAFVSTADPSPRFTTVS